MRYLQWGHSDLEIPNLIPDGTEIILFFRILIIFFTGLEFGTQQITEVSVQIQDGSDLKLEQAQRIACTWTSTLRSLQVRFSNKKR